MSTVMEGPEAAYAQSDLYSDVMAGPPPTNNGQYQPLEANRGPGGLMEYRSYTTIHPKSVEQQEKESKIAANVENIPRGKQLYIGNLTWWTADSELSVAIQECGVTDLISIKFFENRINGQSKGFALVELGSEASQRLCTDRLPNQTLHNQKPIVTQVNKQTLAMFELQARKDKPGLGGTFREEDQRSGYKNYRDREDRKPKQQPPVLPPQGPQIISGFPPPGANVVSAPFFDPNMMHQQAMPLPPSGIPPGSIIVDAMGNIIQGGGMPGVGGPGMVQQGLPPGSIAGPMQQLPPRPGIAPHINPAFIPQQDGHPPIDPITGLPLQTGGLNEHDMESMRRNQAVASTAIQRAMTDANAGEFESGIETLVTAISLIKQSTTANTDPAQVLVQSLQDCLHGLEGQLVQKGSGGRSSRYSGGGDDRDRRRRRDRSRSRSRSRGRRSYSPHRSRSRERRRR